MRDYTFASALLSTKSAGLLSKTQFRDLQATDESGFVLKLQALGYSVSNKNAIVEAILEGEVINLKEEIIQILPYDDLPLLFFTKYDLTNIRSYYKNKLFKSEISDFEEAGFLSKKDLEKAILHDDYLALVEPYKSLFALMNENTFASSHELVSFLQDTLQMLVFNIIKDRKDEALEHYFVISTDISNLLSLLRARRMKFDEEQLRFNLLSHGQMSVSDVLVLLNSDSRDLINRYSSLYMSKFVAPLQEYFANNDFSLLEQSLLHIMIQENKDYAIDITSTASIIDYVVRKQIEIIDIRRLYLDRKAVLMVGA